jgi:hypothetical protein
VFVDELVCMLKPLVAVAFLVVVAGFFELTNDDSGDCLLVVVFWLGDSFPFGASCPAFGGWGVLFSMESLILAQDERWRRA